MPINRKYLIVMSECPINYHADIREYLNGSVLHYLMLKTIYGVAKLIYCSPQGGIHLA